MSFILDALRKSEHARERGALPGLAELPRSSAPPSRLPLVLGVLGALLVINVVVLALVLTRPTAPSPVAAPPTEAAPTAPPAPVAAPPARATTTTTTAPPRTRPLADEADPGALADPALADPALAGDTEPVPAPPRPSRAAAALRPAAAPAPPALNDLPLETVSGLPHLNIDLHVYSPDAQQRFVVINGQRLTEGATLREGPVLERITPDGAILNHQGTHFLLPRR